MLSLDTRQLYRFINFKRNPKHSNDNVLKNQEKKKIFMKLLQIRRVDCNMVEDNPQNYQIIVQKKNSLTKLKRHTPIKKENINGACSNNSPQKNEIDSVPLNISSEKMKLSPQKNNSNEISPNHIVNYSKHNNNERKNKFFFPKKISINVPTIKILNVYSSNNISSNDSDKKVRVFPNFSSKKIEVKKIPLLLLNNEISYINNSSCLSKIHSYNIQTFPLMQNPKSMTQNLVFNYTINKVYRDQFIQYFSHRINWVLINTKIDKTSNINFQWKYLTSRTNFAKCKYDQNVPIKKLRVVNLFERNYELGNKKNLFINLINYCDKIKVNVFEIIPFTITLSNNKNFDLGIKLFQEIFEFLRENYQEITRKNQSQFFLNKLYKTHFYYDSNYTFCNSTYINFPLSYVSSKNYWILKPVNLYQGKCIEISNSFNEITKICQKIFKGVDKTKHLPEIKPHQPPEEEEEELNTENLNGSNEKKKKYAKMYCSNDIVIQKYLDYPLLYRKRKFDIRCYVLVDYNLNVFYCREGHLKSSSELYDLNVSSKFVHITNHSLQKKGENFAKFEYGNEMSYQDFKDYLQEEGISLEYFHKMINRMKFLIEISMNSVCKKIIKTENVLSFEIFGYDFILDQNFKPYILEINSNPGMGISSPVIERLVPRMLDDAFRLTIDKIFETKYDDSVINKETNEYESKYHIDGFKDTENIFEFLCNINK